ncbi:MAG TPA: lipase family protein [Verrucomicrobiota bacterium]|nr:lipase family protein [Verrucomicrobiota bacterium]
MNAALASKLAYLDPGEVKAEAAKWGFENAEFFQQNRTEGFVAWDSQCVLVSFRGTKELGDWLTDLNALRASVSYGELHRGFLDAFNDVRSALRDLVEQAGASGKRVWVTGHSLGGALSTIMAGELLGELPIHGIYTFGQPRVVNRRSQAYFREPYAGRYFRFVNDDDIVPKVPVLLQHVGEILWFDSDGGLKESPPGVRGEDFGPEALSEEEFAAFQERVRSFQSQINREHETVTEEPVAQSLSPLATPAPVTRGLFPSVRDHFMDKYLQKIWAKVQAEG